MALENVTINGKNVPAMKIVNGIRFLKSFNDESIQKAMAMKPETDDIIIATFPKCGTNWTKQILTLILNKGVPVTDPKMFMVGCPFLELTGPDILAKQEPPRRYFCHFDYPTVPKSPDAKYICIIRNPKDCLISLYHFLGGDFDGVFDLFVKGEAIYNDYFDHILSWYEHRNDANVLFLYYEKMKSDIKKAVKDIAAFVGPKYKEWMDDDAVLNDVVKYSSFDYMKVEVNKMANAFRKNAQEEGVGPARAEGHKVELVRKGIVGDWRNVLNSEQNAILDALIEKRLKGTDMYDYWKSVACI